MALRELALAAATLTSVSVAQPPDQQLNFFPNGDLETVNLSEWQIGSNAVITVVQASVDGGPASQCIQVAHTGRNGSLASPWFPAALNRPGLPGIALRFSVAFPEGGPGAMLVRFQGRSSGQGTSPQAVNLLEMRTGYRYVFRVPFSFSTTPTDYRFSCEWTVSAASPPPTRMLIDNIEVIAGQPIEVELTPQVAALTTLVSTHSRVGGVNPQVYLFSFGGPVPQPIQISGIGEGYIYLELSPPASLPVFEQSVLIQRGQLTSLVSGVPFYVQSFAVQFQPLPWVYASDWRRFYLL